MRHEIGEVFGAWVLINPPDIGGITWLARCACGLEKEVRIGDLTTGKSTMCVNCSNLLKRTDSHTYPATYKAWYDMKRRCSDLGNANYGGRGISVCAQWLDSFTNFLEDMGELPSDKQSLDRKDVDGNYEPSNCRWATFTEQVNNTQIAKDRGYSIATEALNSGIPDNVLRARLSRGYSLEDALAKSETTPYSTSTSGIKGISFDSSKGKWRAAVTLSGVRWRSGYFTDAYEAVAALNVKRVEFNLEPVSMDVPL
jgi:hypothetical protein